MKPRSVGTHDGSFHADEVSACALLLTFDLVDRDKIFRTRDPVLLDTCEYVCDVGGIYDPKIKRFDHHQLEYSGSLASAGMIWRYLLDKGQIDEALHRFVNQAIILGVDGHDNGKVMQEDGVCTFSHIIAGFGPVEYDATEKQFNECFAKALDFALGVFQRIFHRYSYIRSSKDLVETAMKSDAPALLFDQPVPWLENFFDLGGEDHPAQFVIMPTGHHWKLRGIPPDRNDKMGVRMPLPQQWAGLRGDELKAVSGISGAIFCHKGRFISIWEMKEDALKALDLILKGVRGS